MNEWTVGGFGVGVSGTCVGGVSCIYSDGVVRRGS